MSDVIKMNVGVHDYYVYPGTTILNEQEHKKYFGVGGLGKKQFFIDYSEFIGMEILKYDPKEGEFIERTD
jgi:hypothetical protein